MQWDPLRADWYVPSGRTPPDVMQVFIDARAEIFWHREAPDDPQTPYGAYATYCLLMLEREVRVSVMKLGECHCMSIQVEYFVDERGNSDFDMYSIGSPPGLLGRHLLSHGFSRMSLADASRHCVDG